MTPTTYINWHCRACGYEHHTTYPGNSYPVECPACGKKETRHGYLILPTNRAWCDKEPRQYDICGGEKTIQVYLCSATGERAGVTLDPDYVPDCDDDPIEVARAVLDILKTKYIYHGGKGDIEKVLTAMEKCEELSEKNRVTNRKNELRKRIVCDTIEYECLQEDTDELARNKAGEPQ